MVVGSCVCDLLQSFDLKTRVLIAMHRVEYRATTNTARLAAMMLSNCEIQMRGILGTEIPRHKVHEPGRVPLLLYPSDTAEPLTPEFARALSGPVTLVVPDGTWRQAAKAARREAAFEGVRHVKLVPGKPTIYWLRREPQPDFICTLEAIARALGVLEGVHVQTALEKVLETVVARTLLSRGLSPRDVRRRGLSVDSV
jgi:DTW domain-containing protein YfiP